MGLIISGQVIASGEINASFTTPPPPELLQLWSWGENEHGQLGLGNTTDYSSPVQIGALIDWSSISSGYVHNHAIKTNGTLWSWGRNNYGQIGNGVAGSLIKTSSPVQIGNLTDWASIHGGVFHSHAIKTDGTLWAWGFNGANVGRLGDGTTIDRSSPVQIGNLTDWFNVAPGFQHTIALKSDNTVWAWGENSFGQLGQAPGNIVDLSSPTQVGTDTDWASVHVGFDHSFAIKTNGELWAWGKGTNGRLGNGGINPATVPGQIGLLTDWAIVDGGNAHSAAVKTDGTLWSWGRNHVGQLGLGNLTDYLSPVQVGVLTDWSSIDVMGLTTVARKTDGTIWAWGEGASGRLGDGTTINRSSPVQIGSETIWNDIEGGREHSIALKIVQ